jgi:hypothetical protein
VEWLVGSTLSEELTLTISRAKLTMLGIGGIIQSGKEEKPAGKGQ